jgi:lipoprotein Spr
VYVTNNHFAHAATTSGVTIASLNDPYWKERYVAAGRAKKNPSASRQPTGSNLASVK